MFCERFLSKGDRTIDQMIQAARSGKQNIAEGSAAASTSKETEIKLTNVAKASLQELLLDYEDFLLTRRLRKWDRSDAATRQTRQVAMSNNDPEYYLARSAHWDAATFANVVITLINQCNVLLRRLIERQKEQFLRQGGIREEMSRARREYRSQQSMPPPPPPTSQTAQTRPTGPTSPSPPSDP